LERVALYEEQQTCQHLKMPKAGEADLVIPVINDRKGKVQICSFLLVFARRLPELIVEAFIRLGGSNLFSTIFAFATQVFFALQCVTVVSKRTAQSEPPQLIEHLARQSSRRAAQREPIQGAEGANRF